MVHTTSFFKRTGWTSFAISGLLAILLLCGCQHSRSRYGCAPAYMPAGGNACGCGTAACEPAAEPAAEPACQSCSLPAAQPAPLTPTKPVRWPAGTSKIAGCTSGCASCQETGCGGALPGVGCRNTHAPRGLFAKKNHYGVLPHACCARCNGPNSCAMCDSGGGSHLPMPGMEAQVCPRCHYRVSCRRTVICQTPDGRVNGCEVFQDRQLDSVQPPAVLPELPSVREPALPAATGPDAPDLLPMLEDSTPAVDPVLPEVYRSAPAARKSPITSKKNGSGPKITPEPITDSTPFPASPLDAEEDSLIPLPPMKEVNILDSDPDTAPEIPAIPDLPETMELPAELTPDILPLELDEDDFLQGLPGDDFIQELPEDARPESPFIDSVSVPKKGARQKTIIREYPEVSEKERPVPLSSRAPGTARTVQYTTAKPTISVTTFHHPLNEVKSNRKSKTPRRDDMVRPIAFQEPIAQPRAQMDADALAEAAAESEKAADEARKQRFSDVQPSARRHNVYPHDEYIIDTTRQAHIQEIKPKRVPAGEIPDDSWSVNAQDAEGTFIHFSTPGGRSSIQTTDPVYIYSPRFRAVRQVIDPTLSGQVVKIGDINTPTTAETQQRNVGADPITQRNQAISETGRTQAIRLSGNAFGAEISETAGLRGFEQEQTIPQVVRLDTTMSHLDSSDSPRVEKRSTGAVTWTSTEQMLVFVDHERAAAGVMVQNAPSLFVVEEKEEKPRVKIYKVASSDAAKSGETVTFTIRFENAGNTPISNIVIADNLPARLALDTESSESSVDVEFTFEPNANGSSLLRWEVVESLQPGDWGVVRFNCVVR